MNQGSTDHFFGRYSIPVGQSVVKRSGTYEVVPYPWLGEIADLEEGVDYFLGGRTYSVSEAVGAALATDGFTVEGLGQGYGEGPYGIGPYGI